MATAIAATSNSLSAPLLNMHSHIGRKGCEWENNHLYTLLGFADPEPPQKYNIYIP